MRKHGEAKAGNGYVGGLVSASGGNITNCYATGNVTGEGEIGGLVGHYYSNITNCYFLKAGANSNLPDDSSNGITGKTAAQMKSQSTFTGFDFTSVWGIDEGASYPYLRDIEENVTNPPGK